jgi:hypothetical protein
LQQIYCTHCTYGSSALERREDELAGRMVGYSARAGSLGGAPLRSVYRQLEGYVYYYLPHDTPADAKQQLTAAAAPRRLVYVPNLRGLRMAGQVCYRTTDSEGRPGSYFAHLAFEEDRGPASALSALEALRLWRAGGWVEEDDPTLPFDLPPLKGPASLLAGRRPVLEDAVLRSFLTTPAGGEFDDPAGAIPMRWRQFESSYRAEAVGFVLASLLAVRPQQRQSVVLVAEPDLAALLFYAALRLLPRGPLAESVSFSTFEHDVQRPPAALTATLFYDPASTDLRPEIYNSGHVVWNTFSGRRSPSAPQQPSPFTQWALGAFIEQGPEAVDRRLQAMEAVGPTNAHELDALAQAEALMPVLFGQAERGPEVDWRRSPQVREYLRRAVIERIHSAGNVEAALEPMLGRQSQAVVLELLAGTEGSDEARRAVEYLLSHMPAGQLGELLRLGTLSVPDKAGVLARLLAADGPLPAAVESFWDKPVMAMALARLDAQALKRVVQRVPPSARPVFLQTAIRAACQGDLRPEAIGTVLEPVDEASLLAVFRRAERELFQGYPADEPVLAGKLRSMARSIPKRPEQFAARLELLVQAKPALGDAETRQIVAAWDDCRRAILDIGRLQADASGMLQRSSDGRLEDAVRRMAVAAAIAMPATMIKDDKQGNGKQKVLKHIGRTLLQGNPLLGGDAWQCQALWQKVHWYFETGIWSAVPLGRLRPKSWKRRLAWAGSAAAALLLVVLLLGWLGGDKQPVQELAADDAPGATGDGQHEPGTDTPTVADARRELAEQQAATEGKRPTQDPLAPARDRGRPSEARREGERNIRPQVTATAEEPPDGPPPANDQSGETAATGSGEPPAGDQAIAPDESPLAEPATSAGPGDESAPEADDVASMDPTPYIESRPDDPADDPFAETADADLAQPEEPAGKPPAAGLSVDDWNTWASDWAGQPHRRVLVNELLLDGKLSIADSDLPPLPEGWQWYLGSGWVHTSVRDYPFGEGFRRRLPTTGHAVDTLADRPLVPRVAVRLGKLDSGYRLAVEAAPTTLPPVPAFGPAAELRRTEARLERLTEALGTFNDRNATVEKHRVALETMREMTETEDATSDRPANEVESAAVMHIDELRKKVSRLKADLPEGLEEPQPPPEDQQAIRRAAEITARCRTISAVLYGAPADSREPLAGTSEADGPSEAGSPTDADAPPGQPPMPSGDGWTGESAAERPPLEEGLPKLDGRFAVDRRRALRLAPPNIARLNLGLLVGKLPPPRWYRENYVTGANVRFLDDDDMWRPAEIDNVKEQHDTPIADGTEAVWVQLIIKRRSNDPFNEKYRVVAQTPWQKIAPVEQEAEYAVTFDVARDRLETLQEIPPE